ncbi:HAMP domain protein, partial [Actinomyces sp. oral taxon 171 str. F0337]
MLMTTVPSSPPPLAGDPVSGPSVPARLRIVAWMLFVVALGLTSMIVSVRSTLMADISRSANADVTHEVKELQNFAATGVDPRTSRPFTSTTRLMEVYRDGQQLTDREAVIIYNHSTGKATQASGASAPTLNPTSTDPLFVKMLQTPSGATSYGSGEVRWARVELEPDNPSQHLSVITMSFTASRVDQLNATIWLMVGISAAVLVLTGVVGLLVARQILRPLHDLRTAAASVSTQDLNRRLPVKGRDDIAGLTEEFNGMLDRLQEAFDGQTQFVLRAHQEISGPLAVMDARLASQPATRTVLQQRAQIAELQRVLDDLQSLTQAERRDFAHLTPDVDVTELARTLCDDVEAMAPDRWSLDLRARGTATLDVERLRQATGHLARNGLQHGDGPLTLTVAPGTDGYGRSGLEISVTDRGPGLSDDDVDWLFERFTHGEADGRPRGSGLGLAIVRAIADAHDGTVFAVSASGQGATP